MKKFRSTATDQQGRKYGGIFEAADLAAARKMLEEEGYQILTLEEIPQTEDAAQPEKGPEKDKEKTGKAGRAEVASRKGRATGLLRPFLISLAVLITFPSFIFLLAPRKTEIPAEEILDYYFNLEFAALYESQFELFSGKRKAQYGSGASYAASRRSQDRIRTQSPGDDAGPETSGEAGERADAVPVLGSIDKIRSAGKEAGLVTFVSRGPVLERYSFDLVKEKSGWKIDGAEKDLMMNLGGPGGAGNPPGTMTRHAFHKTGSAGSSSGDEASLATHKRAMKERALDMLERARAKGVMDEEEYRRKRKELEALSV